VTIKLSHVKKNPFTVEEIKGALGALGSLKKFFLDASGGASGTFTNQKSENLNDIDI